MGEFQQVTYVELLERVVLPLTFIHVNTFILSVLHVQFLFISRANRKKKGQDITILPL